MKYEDEINWILNRFFKENCSKNKNFYVKNLFLKIADFSRFPVPTKNPDPGFSGPGNSPVLIFLKIPGPVLP